MEETLLNAAIQLPIVGLFVWFILKFWDRIDDMLKQRDDAFLLSLQEERVHRVEMMDKERESRAALASRLSEVVGEVGADVKLVLTKIDTLSETMHRHDARAEQYIHSAKKEE